MVSHETFLVPGQDRPECQPRPDGAAQGHGPTPMDYGAFRLHAQRAAGLLLMAAATLKYWHDLHSPPVGENWWNRPVPEPALIAWETFLGLWLISGALPRVARRVAIGCFSVFACYTLYEALAGKADCGCFGQVQVNPWFTFILDVSLALALTFLGKPGAGKAGNSRWARQKWPVAAAAAIGLAVGVTVAMLHPKVVSAANGLATADRGKIVILEPHHWIGHRLPVLGHIVSQHGNTPLGQRLATGNWVIMFYHASCDECRRTIPIYEQLAQREMLAGKTPHVAFVRVPSGSGVSARGLFHSNIALHGTMDATHDWFAETPIVLQMRSGRVVAEASGHAAMDIRWMESRRP